jgi:predicted  nucleic acid-binding Zn-ribbon protein
MTMNKIIEFECIKCGNITTPKYAKTTGKEIKCYNCGNNSFKLNISEEETSRTFSVRINKNDPLSITQQKIEDLKGKIAGFLEVPDFKIK